MPQPSYKLLVIINPVSGQGDLDEARATIRERLDATGVEYKIKLTEKEGDALRWAREADGYERILVAGGDGTVMEALSGTIENERNIPLAQIPLGTANLLARALGVPIETGDAMTLALETGVATHMDVGYLPSHEKYFALVAGAGWDALMIEEADRELKNSLGFFAYLYTGIRNLFTLESSRITVHIDGKRKRLRAHTLMVINVGEIHDSKIALGRDVTPHDGKLNLAIVAMKRPFATIRLIYRILTRQFDGSPELRYFPAEHLKIEADPPLKFEIDGEAIGETPFEVKVVPSGALLVVPESYVATKGIDFRNLPDLMQNAQ